MTTGDNRRTGGELLVDTLLANNTDMAFCVPGESYLSVLDAMHGRNEVQVVPSTRLRSWQFRVALVIGERSRRSHTSRDAVLVLH